MKHNMGLLILRLTMGGLMLVHGYGKLVGFSEMSATFPDVIGIGGKLSLILVIFAEFFCAFALVLGLLTRLATIPLIINMAVAAGVAHAGDPWGKKELAVIYLLGYIVIGLLGAGRYSIDSFVLKKH